MGPLDFYGYYCIGNDLREDKSDQTAVLRVNDERW